MTTIPRSGFPVCYASIYWWDGEYDNSCELRKDHPEGIHCDSIGTWFNDDNEEILLDDGVEKYILSIYGAPKGLMVV
jgi:hypothetical protein